MIYSVRLYDDSAVRQKMVISLSVINFQILRMHLNIRTILLVHFFSQTHDP